MSELVWDQSELARQLWQSYGLSVVSAQLVGAGVSTARWLVACPGRRVMVVQYLSADAADAARPGLDMHELCRAAHVAAPRVLTGSDGGLLTTTSLGRCSVTWALTGPELQLPLQAAQAQHLGMNLAFLHRATAAYPPVTEHPRPPEARWYATPLDQVLASTDAAARSIPLRSRDDRRRLDGYLTALHTHLLPRVPGLRAEVGHDRLVVHAVHGAYLPRNLYPIVGSVPRVTGFAARTAHLAWEIARIAYHPRTVAHSQRWLDSAAALLVAYHRTRPGLPGRDLLASARIAVLQLLTNPPLGASLSVWSTRITTLRRLLGHLPRIDAVVQDAAGLPLRPT
ncbi:hypothetical protein ACIA78_34820 [Streptomyces xanthochromogenes]|uniref:hypothetical protein n=1 Tax=Streptomyces xanthochromogenes TaxID=67384 RepID=UPI0037891F59